MPVTDPIADMLTRLRNAVQTRSPEVRMPASNVKIAIAKMLQREGYIKGVQVIKQSPQNVLRLVLKYDDKRQPPFSVVRRVSKPGCRVYVGRKRVPRVIGGLGIAILSTSHGIVTDEQARRLGVGGEVLCEVW